MAGYIYGLVDPRDGFVRYVGQSVHHPDVRTLAHVTEAKARQHAFPHGRKVAWLAGLLNDGYMPHVTILEEVEPTDLTAREKWWIAHLAEQPGGVTNVFGAPDTKEYLRKYYASKGIEPDVSDMEPAELKAVRAALGMSQAAFARALGYHYSNISLWENGKRPIPRRLRIAIRGLG